MSMADKKVELLAPAGNYESFLGAIHAGADAVYLGGKKFGARAYADNFSEEEICRAISYAHIFGRKVYLTVNTLIKDSEFPQLIPYLAPFYLAGLDGVIVQDIGAFLAIRDTFPGLELHVSTQMTVTGSYGARMLKELGAMRIVPARELSLSEIQTIKEETGLEIETFVHGAMCYCYSGQCLFSSILGGRSGNRGRCAQPCRLPYRIGSGDKIGAEQYPLSLKDMCTISFLPRLIEAGIDSFKIEGRMKKPEYAAGVTAIYRKYIDLYYQKKVPYKVQEADFKKLSSLYIRSQIQEGYYFKHNGADMATLSSPAYNGSDEQLLADIRKQYIEMPLKKRITMEAVFKAGEEARLTVSCTKQEETLSVTVTGEMVLLANKQPITEDNIRKGLQKLGNTAFYAEASDISIYADDDIFYPLKAINELRRAALLALEQAFCGYERTLPERDDMMQEVYPARENHGAVHLPEEKKMVEGKRKANAFCILVSTPAQLQAVLQTDLVFDALYLESDMVRLSEAALEKCREKLAKKGLSAQIYIALPYIVRKHDIVGLASLFPLLQKADGCLVRNMEAFYWLQKQAYKGKIITDTGIYCFNRQTLAFWLAKADGCTLPYELNQKELRQLSKEVNTIQCLSGGAEADVEQIVYGYIPLMITANCIAKTAGKCIKDGFMQDSLFLKDRYKKAFPVAVNCRHCYNIIYNSVPLSLHEKVLGGKAGNIRLMFTLETGERTAEIMRFFAGLQNGQNGLPPYAEYTLGHEKRGIE